MREPSVAGTATSSHVTPVSKGVKPHRSDALGLGSVSLLTTYSVKSHRAVVAPPTKTLPIGMAIGTLPANRRKSTNRILRPNRGGGRRVAGSKGRDDRRPTTDDRRPTTDDRRPTTDDRRPNRA
jgi:hypothetical protein